GMNAILAPSVSQIIFLLGLSSTTFPTSFGFTLSGLFSIQPTPAKQQRNVEPSQFHFSHFSV
ncbi:TPA: hypothetical protein DHW51_02440, partial [Candidatus Poribacteria bacterium]|nr:hypothetical protein [Candidatus Poribacteria bacterium]